MHRILKDRRIVFLLIILAVVYVSFLYLDIASKYGQVSTFLKYTGISICFLIAVLTYKHSFDPDDAKLLILALFFTLLSDSLFLLASAVVLGIVSFSFAHLCYIRRYRKKLFKRYFTISLAVMIFCLVAFIFGLQLPYLFILGTVYGILIATATFLAFKSNLPKINKRLVKTGMILFLLCDTNMALAFLTPKTSLIHETAGTLVWLFYLPSQALLALSAADYEKGRA